VLLGIESKTIKERIKYNAWNNYRS